EAVHEEGRFDDPVLRVERRQVLFRRDAVAVLVRDERLVPARQIPHRRVDVRAGERLARQVVEHALLLIGEGRELRTEVLQDGTDAGRDLTAELRDVRERSRSERGEVSRDESLERSVLARPRSVPYPVALCVV